MVKTSGTTPQDIMQQVRQGHIAPVYLLHGDEDYYIDRVAQEILDHLLQPEERDFNLDIVYGSDKRGNDIINLSRQFPMMAERRVVMVREFQSCTTKETLASYVQNPMQSTVLILCHKHGLMDGRKSLVNDIKKYSGVVMESRRLWEHQLPSFINQHAKELHLKIEPKAIQMLCEHVGTDLTRMASEMEKLKIAVPQGSDTITDNLVEEQTGVSKEYNNFELQKALAVRDVAKANKIVNYFYNSPKNFALPPLLSTLFSFFSDVMLAYYAPNQTPAGIAQWLGKNEWTVKNGIYDARQKYAGRKVVVILDKIRQTDAKSKGVGGAKTPPGELLQELVFFILH